MKSNVKKSSFMLPLVHRTSWTLAVNSVLNRIKRTHRFTSPSAETDEENDRDESEFVIQKMVIKIIYVCILIYCVNI